MDEEPVAPGGLPVPGTPLMGGRSEVVTAGLVEFDGRPVSCFRVEGGKHRGAVGEAGGAAMERAVRAGIDHGIPIVGILSTSGADIGEGVAALHAWGRVARALGDASGVVPTLFAVIGPCVSGPALLLGLVDHVVMTPDAFAYVSGPDTVAEFTGVRVDHNRLGGARVHGGRSGVAALVVDDEDDALAVIADLLDRLPSNHLDDAPHYRSDDPVDRDCELAASVVPARANASYDVREVVGDVLDHGTFLELRPGYAPNLVTGLGRLDGRSVGVIANQPLRRAGTIDIEASRKGARFVQWCDEFNLPIVTFVDTPGFEPGRDLEWRGMIRHGAELVFAYGAATVPRLCVVIRKAYGGAYIVMDSKDLGNDLCIAWPNAEIAVMGAAGAVQILHRKRLAGIAHPGERQGEQVRLEREYDERFSNPYAAAERGYVDAVVVPLDTRRVLATALTQLCTKREQHPARRHSNTPL